MTFFFQACNLADLQKKGKRYVSLFFLYAYNYHYIPDIIYYPYILSSMQGFIYSYHDFYALGFHHCAKKRKCFKDVTHLISGDMSDHEGCVRPWGEGELMEMADELVFDPFNDVTEDL